jgi:hypothetical protein
MLERSHVVFSTSLFFLMGVGALLSDFVPSLSIAFGARLLLLPAIFFACALTVRFPLMLAFAFVAGLGWDARHMVVEEGSGTGFGYSVFLFALTGSLLQGVRPLFRRGRWELPLFIVGAATTILLVAEWFLISFARGNFSWPGDFWYQVWTSTLLCMLISPVLFYLIFKLGKLSGAPVHLGREIEREGF